MALAVTSWPNPIISVHFQPTCYWNPLCPIAAAWPPSFLPWTRAIPSSFFFLFLLNLPSTPDLSDWSPWAISKFLPHLFTLPLLKIGHCCPWLFRQCQNPWDILWSPLAFDLNTSPVSAYIPPHPCPRVPSLVPWATGPLHSSLWLEYPSLFPWTNLLLLNHFHIISPSHRSFFFFLSGSFFKGLYWICYIGISILCFVGLVMSHVKS